MPSETDPSTLGPLSEPASAGVGSASTGLSFSIGSVSSGLSFSAKMAVALAAFAQSIGFGAFMFLPNMYMDVFKGNATLIGVFSIIVVPFDIVFDSFIGRHSDKGFFNKGCFRDIEKYGRRAPLTFMSIPILGVSFLLGFTGPENLGNPVAVAIWYGVVRFALSIGGGLLETASSAAFTELFTSKEERAQVTLMKFVAGMVGGLIGGVSIGTVAIDATKRHIFPIFGIITSLLWLLVVPHACIQTRTIMTQTESQESSICRSLTQIWRASKSFRLFAVALHLFSGNTGLLIFVLPFYLKVVLGYTDEEKSRGVQVVFLTAGLTMPLTAPLVLWLNKRMDQSMMAGVAGLISVIIAGCHANVAFVVSGYWIQVGQLGVLCGSGLGAVILAWALANGVLFKYIVDEDQVCRAEQNGLLLRETISVEEIPARRDGTFTAIRSAFGISGLAWQGLFQFLLGAFGYDADRDTQPKNVRSLLLVTYTIFQPLMYLAFAVTMFLYPMRGKMLKRLKQRYARIYGALVDDAKPQNCPVEQKEGEEVTMAVASVAEMTNVSEPLPIGKISL